MPRLRNAAFLLLIAALAALKMCQKADPDLFWQLKDGERIVREGVLPLREEYSSTAAGRSMVAAEWLAETVSYGVFRVAGYGGLVAFNSALFAAAFAFLLALVRRRVDPVRGFCLASLAAFAFLNFYAIRAQNWTFLFTALFLYWARLWENGDERVPWAMAAVLLPWVNLHGGFMLGWGILGLLCLRRSWESRRAADLAPWALGTLLCCVHPNGAMALVYPAWFMAVPPAGRALVLEWRPVDFGDVTAAPYLILLASLLWVGLRGARARFPWGALTLALAVLALRGRKLLPEFTLAGIAALALKLGGLKRERGVLSAGAALAVSASFWVALHPLPSLDLERGYPREAARIIAERYPGAGLFHDYDWGGYLIYALYPRNRVFIDGRLDPYWRLFSGDYSTIMEQKPGWKALLDDYRISTALLRPTDRLCEGLSRDPAWKMAYGDARSVLFVRRI